jgi:hypothetical protein
VTQLENANLTDTRRTKIITYLRLRVYQAGLVKKCGKCALANEGGVHNIEART